MILGKKNNNPYIILAKQNGHNKYPIKDKP